MLGAPGLDGRTLDLTKRTVVFEGGVQEAIKGFPKNINVGVIASLASQKPQTKVRIVADPAANSNTHQITYRSALADAVMEFSGKPDPANPKSSTTAALSAAACLKNLYSRYLEAIQTCTLLLSSLFDEAERGDSFTTRATPEVLSETVWFNDFQPT